MAKQDPTSPCTYLRPATKGERSRLDRAVEKGRLVRPYPNTYVPTEWWVEQDPLTQHLCRAHACSAIHPNWIFCSATAAALWGLQPPYEQLGKLQVVVPQRKHPQNTALVTFHRCDSLESVSLAGIRVTTCERTAVDCMRTFPPLDGLAIADSAIRRTNSDNLHLAKYLSEKVEAKLRGLARARLISLLADGKSESGGESIARGNMICCGFALPNLQEEVIGKVDGRRYRVDFSWAVDGTGAGPKGRIFGELDGRRKYIDKVMASGDSIDAILSERHRESELTLQCQAIVRFSYQEACSPRLLSRKLDAFGIPRVCEPLTFTASAKHNEGEVLRYLKANAACNPSARERLNYLVDQRLGFPY